VTTPRRADRRQKGDDVTVHLSKDGIAHVNDSTSTDEKKKLVGRDDVIE
jgi:hypothetical protein